MTKSRSNSWVGVLPGLMLPILLGMAIYFVLIGSIQNGMIENELVARYITGHPVSKVTTAMFLVGMVALLLVGSELLDQFRSLNKITLRQVPVRRKRKPKSKRIKRTETPASEVQPDSDSDSREEGIEDDRQSIAIGDITTNDASEKPDVGKKVSVLQDRLFQLPKRMQSAYLWRRLHSALQFVRQHKSAGGLDDELKYLADTDADHKHERYSLVRILIWATPMLGFLGTVLGISEALGGIAVGGENNFQSMMSGLQTSLYVAFDTTALALTFSVVLMFVQFLAERFESQLLLAVEQRAKIELNQQFTIEFEREDGVVKLIKEMNSEIVNLTEKLVRNQCKIWNESITSAQKAWVESIDSAQQLAQENICSALNNSTDKFGQEIGRSIERVDKTLERRIGQWQVSLSQLAHEINEQQQNVSLQTGAVVDAATQFKSVGELQKHLLEYMQTLPESNDLIDASEKLSTAIRLLEFRIGPAPEKTIAQQQRNQILESKIIVPQRKAA